MLTRARSLSRALSVSDSVAVSASVCCCAVVLLRCCAAVLLCYCAAVLLHCAALCYAVLCCSAVVLLCCCAAAAVVLMKWLCRQALAPAHDWVCGVCSYAARRKRWWATLRLDSDCWRRRIGALAALTLHCIALHCSALHCIALQCIVSGAADLCFQRISIILGESERMVRRCMYSRLSLWLWLWLWLCFCGSIDSIDR